MQIEVQGAGVAALCCRRLLTRNGFRVSFESHVRPKVPAVLLSPATQQLLEDVFGRKDLLVGLKEIRRRVVAWGSQESVSLPHSGLVVSEEELIGRIGQFERPSIDAADWTIHTGKPESALQFGSRFASAARVGLSAAADSSACLMESCRDGWLFLLPTSVDSAILLGAGSTLERLLGQSHLVQLSIGSLLEEVGRFQCNPRIADPLCADHWLACGSAAVAFDPLCGDGTGHAIREAILACAIVASEAAIDELLWEYRLRLWRGFQRHLELCLQFYSTGGDGEWWRAQCGSLREGLRWVHERRSPYPLGRFHLNGFDLEFAAHPLSSAH